jgi:hypothetical protein
MALSLFPTHAAALKKTTKATTFVWLARSPAIKTSVATPAPLPTARPLTAWPPGHDILDLGSKRGRFPLKINPLHLSSFMPYCSICECSACGACRLLPKEEARDDESALSLPAAAASAAACAPNRPFQLHTQVQLCVRACFPAPLTPFQEHAGAHSHNQPSNAFFDPAAGKFCVCGGVYDVGDSMVTPVPFEERPSCLNRLCLARCNASCATCGTTQSTPTGACLHIPSSELVTLHAPHRRTLPADSECEACASASLCCCRLLAFHCAVPAVTAAVCV